MNLIQKYGLIGLTIALLFPAFFVNSHVFAHEFKFGCDNNSTTHLHQSALDCKICKFHPAPIVGLDFARFVLFQNNIIHQAFPDSYFYLNDFQKLSFQLRGPPTSCLIS